MEKLTASFELDKRIAEEVMGLQQCPAWSLFEPDCHGRPTWVRDMALCLHPKGRVCDPDPCYPPESPPRYSIDIGRAGQLLGKLLEWAAQHDTAITFGYAPATGYRCTAYEPLMDGCPEHYSWPKADDYYDTPMLAICAAALKCLQGEK